MTQPLHRKTLRIGHSPDPDDAYMWYPLTNRSQPHPGEDNDPADQPDDASAPSPSSPAYDPHIDTEPYEFVHVLEDIQTLNDRAARAELEITALSIHQYPFVAKDYALTSCGASIGDGYGPMVVARRDSGLLRDPKDLLRPGIKVAIPGKRTTAFLTLMLMLREMGMENPEENLQTEVVMFDRIIPAVADGRYDAGLIIHEGQLTYGKAGLHCVADLGQWWKQTRDLPLPLGGNAIRRDLHNEMGPICAILLQSILYALEHREEAIQYALHYARDLGRDLADRFVGLYVNHWTIDYTPTGRQAVQRLLAEGADAGLLPPCGEIDFIDPS